MIADSLYRVGVALLDGFSTLSFAAAVEPFRAANLLANRTLYEVTFFAHKEYAESSGNALIKADHSIGKVIDCDLLLIVAGSDVNGQPVMTYEDRVLIAWLKKQARHTELMGGVSGGPAMLAQASLMNQRRMTIHWDHAEVLRTRYPELLLEQSRYVMDRNRVTCAGGTAALDMLHALISHHHGAQFARQVSDWFLHTDIRKSEDAQRAGITERFNIYNAALLVVIELMENHIGDPMDTSQLAKVAGLSSRQLNRLFMTNLNSSPIAFYRVLRLEKAKALLSQSALPISEIALACGFFDNAHFTRSFGKQFGYPPSQVRASLPNTIVR